MDAMILEKLKKAAKDVSKNFYAPYSKFSVGAAILTASGNIHAGCNVENISYGLSNCAERTAVFSAVAAGDLKRGDLSIVVVYTPTLTITTPCGACRQVMAEFAKPDSIIFCFCDSEKTLQMTMKEMLPSAFTL